MIALAIERGREGEVLRASQQLPRVAGAFSKATMLRNMQELSARNVRIMSTVLTTFACIIAIVFIVVKERAERLVLRLW